MGEFALLLEAEIPRLRRYARALCQDASRADDLVQSCLTRAIIKQHLWQAGSDLSAWLMTMMHNEHVNDLRRRARSLRTVPIEEAGSIRSVAPDGFDAVELWDLWVAIGKLSDKRRQALLLVGLEELPYDDASSVLGIPTGTLRSRLGRARYDLRKLMGIDPKNRRTATAHIRTGRNSAADRTAHRLERVASALNSAL